MPQYAGRGHRRAATVSFNLQRDRKVGAGQALAGFLGPLDGTEVAHAEQITKAGRRKFRRIGKSIKIKVIEV
jgi:hypothetical protein